MPLLRRLGRWLVEKNLSADERERLMSSVTELNSAGFDPWGLHPETAMAALAAARPLYDKYFRVEARGLDRLPKGRVFLIGNHGGQLPLDGLLVATAVSLYADPPRIVRGMVERWFPSLPFVSPLFVRSGQTVGDPRNCRRLLEHEQAVMVFPEGVRGSGKTIWHRYELQKFGTGFMRLALETGTPIVPVAVIGSEETYPSVYNAKTLARLIGAPYAPITPFFPLLGPVGALPLPCKVWLHFGEPMSFEGDFDAPDHEIQDKVDSVSSMLQSMINVGLRERGMKIF